MFFYNYIRGLKVKQLDYLKYYEEKQFNKFEI